MARCGVVAIVQGASMLVGAGAQAQTAACDQLKATLAARIEAGGVRGYTLETVPADDPVPAGAKAIGTCESGAYKVLYRRSGAAAAAATGASAAEPGVAPRAVVATDEPTRRAPVVQRERASRPLAASVPAAAPQPVSRPGEAAAVPPLARASEPAPPGATSAVDTVRAAAPPAAAITDAMPGAAMPLARQLSGLVAGHWRWIGALVLLSAAAAIWWLWRTRYSPYDAAGLPRGPRL